MRHYASARRPAHSGKPAHDEHEQEYDGDIEGLVCTERYKAHRHHRDGGEHKAYNKEFPGVRAV